MVHPTVKNSQGIDKYRDKFNEWKYTNSDLSRMTLNTPTSSDTDVVDDGSGMMEDYKDPWTFADAGYSAYSSQAGRGYRGRSSHERSPRSENSGSGRVSKDEKLAREAGITFSIGQIVGLPMDEFNDLLSRNELTEEQLNLCRDIRRRGKNKVAAQNCRKRKLDQVEDLQYRLAESRRLGRTLAQRHESVLQEYNEEASKTNKMIDDILISYKMNPAHYTIQKINGEVKITKKTSDAEPEGSLRPIPLGDCYLPNNYNYMNSINSYQYN